MRFNDKLENGVSAERVVERVNRLKKRGWADKVDFAEIEEFVKKSERVEIAKKAKRAKKAKSENVQVSRSGRAWCNEEKRSAHGGPFGRNSGSGMRIDPVVVNLYIGSSP